MQVDVHGFLCGRRLLIAVVVAVGLSAALSSRAEAQIDVSGDWNISFEGAFSGTCTSAMQQTGSNLFAALDCTLVGSGTLSGSIDPATGAFSLSGSLLGFTVELEGTASEDGNSLSGTWNADLLGFSGTFTGTRKDETPSLIDLSGDWVVILDGRYIHVDDVVSATCTASFDQTLADLDAAMDCEGLGSGSFTGTVNPLTGSFNLTGSLDDLLVRFSGSAIDQAQVITGTWYNTARNLVGQFIGVRAGESASGIMVVDCDGEEFGRQTNCAYPQEASFQVQIHVAVPPAEGYTGFQAKLQWTEGVLQYLPSPDPLDEALWPPCVIPERSAVDGSSVAFGCTPELAEGDTFTGTVVQIEMQCQGSNTATSVDLLPREGDPQQGTYFLDVEGSPIDPVLISATVACFGPSGVGGPDGLLGDFPAGYTSPEPTEALAPTEEEAATLTETPSTKALALPASGGGRPTSGSRLPLVALLALGGGLLLVGAWRVRLGGQR